MFKYDMRTLSTSGNFGELDIYVYKFRMDK